jgi:hypothetical protein
MMPNTIYSSIFISVIVLAGCAKSVNNSLPAPSKAAAAIEDTRFKRRAMEAGTWIIPQVMYSVMADNTLEIFGGDRNNTIYYYAHKMTWHGQVATGNNNTPYVHTYHDLSNGPVVIEIPAASEEGAFFGTLLDSWHKPLIDVGPGGEDNGSGGRYLLVQPGYDGPTDGYIVVEQETNFGYTAIRSLVKGTTPEDYAKSSEYIKKMKIYPLGASTETVHIAMDEVELPAYIKFDGTFFERARSMIDRETIKFDEKAMYGMMKQIGIEKGIDFKDDPRYSEAAKAIQAEIKNDFTIYAPRIWGEKSQWTIPVNMEMMETDATYIDDNWNDYSGRATTFFYYFAPPKSLAESKSTAYFKGILDINGNPLNGSNDYKTTLVHENVPAAQFYSYLTYSMETASYIRNSERLGVSSIDSDFVKNEDGTVDVYWSSNCAEKEYPNCMPTEKNEEWFTLFRLYSPTKGLRDGSFIIPDIELVH